LLQHVRARITPAALIPTTLVLSTALAFGMIATAPAQASQTSSATRMVATNVATHASVVPSAAQKAAAKARAARVAAARVAARAAQVVRIRSKIVALAKSRVGHSRYVAGAAGPSNFDCSGLALWVYKKAAGISLPHYSKAQFGRVHKISSRQLRPGDLVFFFRNGAHHVAIYIGGGKMVGAANPRSGITMDFVFGPWYGSHYSGAGRLL
jgi:cell wall-associated NlpC family hydrolase